MSATAVRRTEYDIYKEVSYMLSLTTLDMQRGINALIKHNICNPDYSMDGTIASEPYHIYLAHTDGNAAIHFMHACFYSNLLVGLKFNSVEAFLAHARAVEKTNIEQELQRIQQEQEEQKQALEAALSQDFEEEPQAQRLPSPRYSSSSTTDPDSATSTPPIGSGTCIPSYQIPLPAKDNHDEEEDEAEQLTPELCDSSPQPPRKRRAHRSSAEESLVYSP